MLRSAVPYPVECCGLTPHAAEPRKYDAGESRPYRRLQGRLPLQPLSVPSPTAYWRPGSSALRNTRPRPPGMSESPEPLADSTATPTGQITSWVSLYSHAVSDGADSPMETLESADSWSADNFRPLCYSHPPCFLAISDIRYCSMCCSV